MKCTDAEFPSKDILGDEETDCCSNERCDGCANGTKMLDEKIIER